MARQPLRNTAGDGFGSLKRPTSSRHRVQLAGRCPVETIEPDRCLKVQINPASFFYLYARGEVSEDAGMHQARGIDA
jgi:hypothetical protein